MNSKIIIGLLSLVCITLIPVAYAAPSFVDSFGTTGTTADGKLNNPVALTVSSDGKLIYVVDNENNRIVVFESDYDMSSIFGSKCNLSTRQDCNSDAMGATAEGDGQFLNPHTIFLDDSDIFVADSDNNRIQKFDTSGDFKKKFGSQTHTPSAQGVVVHGSHILVSGGSTSTSFISIHDSTGNLESKFTSYHSGDSLKGPEHMLVVGDFLYVADTDNHQVLIFQFTDNCPTGTTNPPGTSGIICYIDKFGSYGSADSKFDEPIGLAYNSTDNLLYVADSKNHRIQIFKIDTTDFKSTSSTCAVGVSAAKGVCRIDSFGSEGTGNGEFKTPLGLALDSKNNLLYVADSGNDRIQKFGTAESASTSTVSELPPKPSGLKASGASKSSIVLYWTAPELESGVSEISGYKVEYKGSSGSYIHLPGPENSTATKFIHSDLEKGTYSYRVYSINSAGTSSGFSNVNVGPADSSSPVGLSAVAISPTSAKLTWIGPSKTIAGSVGSYEIYSMFGRGTDYTKGTLLSTTTSAETSFTLTTLATDKEINIAVRGKIQTGVTDFSNVVTVKPTVNSTDTSQEAVTIKSGIPDSPKSFTAKSVSATQIDLSWNAPDDGGLPIKNYKIKFNADSTIFQDLVTTNASTTTYSHTDLTTGSLYAYEILAVNDVGSTKTPSTATATPTEPDLKLKPLSPFKIKEGETLSFTASLTDTSITGAVYSLENNPPSDAKISTSGQFSWKSSTSDGGNSFLFDLVVKVGSKTDRHTIKVEVTDITDVKTADPVATTDPKKSDKPKESKPLGIASFVDSTADPQTYVDRYNNEPTYKKWFDDSYSQYDSIYDAVGLVDPAKAKADTPKGETTIASFVDSTADPQTYVDRYNNEPTYKKWFDDSYSQYDSIYDAVGLEDPAKAKADTPKGETKIAEFVEPGVDPQEYIDRYDTEPRYKKWFDVTYPEYDSIYDAVGLENPANAAPVADKKAFGKCGPGTKLINKICEVIQQPSAKSWWKFW